jgi:hypothetical protein
MRTDNAPKEFDHGPFVVPLLRDAIHPGAQQQERAQQARRTRKRDAQSHLDARQGLALQPSPEADHRH